jgi:hypothetical protein
MGTTIGNRYMERIHVRCIKTYEPPYGYRVFSIQKLDCGCYEVLLDLD